MDYIICAYHTDDPTYNRHTEELKNSLLSLDIKNFHFDTIPPIENWVNACAVKSQMIQEWFKATDKDILYIDVDGRFNKRPILFDSYPHDIGVFYKNDVELVSSTVYLKNNERVVELINRWVEKQKQHPDIWDQKVFQMILENESDDLNLDIGYLPVEYCKILDIGEDIPEDAVIYQLQASRDHRDKKINRITLSSDAALKMLNGESITIQGITAGNVAIKFNDISEIREQLKND